MNNNKSRYSETVRIKYGFKKHISTSPLQIYEQRGWVGRKVRMWMNKLLKVSPPLTRYRATKQLNKRVTS